MTQRRIRHYVRTTPEGKVLQHMRTTQDQIPPGWEEIVDIHAAERLMRDPRRFKVQNGQAAKLPTVRMSSDVDWFTVSGPGEEKGEARIVFRGMPDEMTELEVSVNNRKMMIPKGEILVLDPRPGDDETTARNWKIEITDDRVDPEPRRLVVRQVPREVQRYREWRKNNPDD